MAQETLTHRLPGRHFFSGPQNTITVATARGRLAQNTYPREKSFRLSAGAAAGANSAKVSSNTLVTREIASFTADFCSA